MKKSLMIALILILSVSVAAQELPQFAYNNYEGWIYNNPGLELNPQTIGGAQIRLYVDSQGLVLSLVSPEFSCADLDSICTEVKWRSESPTVALTMALDDADGNPLDSAVCLPSGSSSNQTLIFTVPVPRDLSTARVRFVSWNAVAATSGAIRIVTMTGIASSAHEVHLGDVDGDGNVTISDVTVLIRYLLSKSGNINMEASDTDCDGTITINDVSTLINMLLRHIV